MNALKTAGAGRALPFAFIKGGAETSRLMNLINLPMDGSATIRKMQNASGGDAHAKAKAKPVKADVGLLMKKELSGVEGLDIRLKPGEVKKLQKISADDKVCEWGLSQCSFIIFESLTIVRIPFLAALDAIIIILR